MIRIDDRFYMTENGILFDTDSNLPTKPLGGSISDAISILSPFNVRLNQRVLSTASYADGSNFAINLNLTSACNLNCTYCFARGGDYGDKKDNMSEDILPALRNLILHNVTPSKKVRFEYFGGEPLLNEKMVHALIRFSHELEEEHGIHILHRVSTNLTKLSDSLLKALCEANFVVSVSIDGTKAVQDMQRPSRNGRSSYDTILDNVKRIKGTNPNIRTVARMTVAQKDTPILDNIVDLISSGLFDYVSIYPASVLSRDGLRYVYYFDDDIKEQYHNMFTHYHELCRMSGFKGFLEVEKILDSLLHGKLSVSHCSAGGNYCTISSDASIVTCHRLCGQAAYVLNRDGTGILDHALQAKWSKKVDDDSVCCKCYARYICGGGCKQEHISRTGSLSTKNTDACAYRMFFLEEILSNIEHLALEFNDRYVSLDDMFVYCGRPVVPNKRVLPPNKSEFLKMFHLQEG